MTHDREGAIIRELGDLVPRLHASAWVAPGASVVGDVTIGADSSIWYATVVRGDVHHVRIGARTNVQDGSVIHVTRGRYATEIADDVTVGHRAVVHGCQVEAGALIGIGAVVLDGAKVGSDALVGAGAVVTPGSVIPARTLVVGTPARPVRELDVAEIRLQRERTLQYVANARLHAAGRTQRSAGGT